METTNRTSKREQILWIAVAILGLIILALLFMYLRTPKGNTPLPSGTLEEFGLTTTPSPSATSTISPMPTLEELPYENTPSDLGMNPNEFATETLSVEDGGGLDSTPEGTATWFVRPFTTRTNTPVPRSYSGGGSGGGGFVYKTPTPSNYGATSTAFWRNQTRTATKLVPTRKTATEAARQTASFVAFQTNIAKTPRPQQLAYDTGSGGSDGNIILLQVPLNWTPTPKPSTTPMAFGTGQMGDWAPGGLRFVYSEEDGGSERLKILTVNANGTVNATPNPNPKTLTIIDGINDQAAWSPNNFWIVFRHKGGSRPPGLYRVDPGGTVLQQLTNDPEDQTPDWSTDSSTIVFSNTGTIFSIKVNAFSAVLTTPTGTYPTYTPSPAPTIIPTRTTLASGNNFTWPHFSPDMRYLIMQGGDATNTDIYLLDYPPKFSEPNNLTTGLPGNYFEPFWTRDAGKFMFLSDRDGPLNAYVMDTNRNITAVTTDGGPKSHPRLRP